MSASIIPMNRACGAENSWTKRFHALLRPGWGISITRATKPPTHSCSRSICAKSSRAMATVRSVQPLARTRISHTSRRALPAIHHNELMSDPKVTIILRSFNEGWALRDTLPALHAQEYRDWELIAFDSGSTDGSVELLRGAQPKHFVQLLPHDYQPSR